MNLTKKYMITIFSILSILATIAWFTVIPALIYGYFGDHQFVKSESSGVIYGVVVYLLPVITIVSLVFSHGNRSKHSLLWSIIPLIYVVIFLGYHQIRAMIEDRNDNNYTTKVTSKFSKDFICPRDEANRFLTVDTEQGAIFEIAPGLANVGIGPVIIGTPVGKIEGGNLLANREKDPYSYLVGCVNADKKTIFDLYYVVYDKKHFDRDDYNLEKYIIKKN